MGHRRMRKIPLILWVLRRILWICWILWTHISLAISPSNTVAKVDFEHWCFPKIAKASVCSIAKDRHYMMDIRVAWLPMEPVVFAAMASFVWFVMVGVLDHCLV